ncbi:hypothetical protein P152DRAFT_405501 [Eremomyces bilateralis CBS 781.70]|uniref:Alpha/beta hydrolase fold-3 domain-containing protein n=1 Tax=Eremomyces bilateralis CBS 781.70 TaxID=1392243 RepID=A0A6G1FRZ2_9PEZI|nr:uncharacterized protein P152DRAFT_405501 [Eremomyces bilateralis CBS 781.70]KAF1808442.1 hypothetical protein P152DRAFT_405501 [Eremomyces bilateralis CBS 781.70]
MPLTSDITLDASKFAPDAGPAKTYETNKGIQDLMSKTPYWFEVGAPKYREMREKGQTAFPAPRRLPEGKNIEIPSREAGRNIPCRLMLPSSGTVKGTYLFIHGGGWVLMSESDYDLYLKFVADNCDLAVISVGYRLAPEHPFPQGPEDCIDAAEYLVDNSQDKFGGELMFIGGDSAGGHLTAVAGLQLLKSRPNFSLRGLVYLYGAFNLAHWFPSVVNFDKTLILDHKIMGAFSNAFLPNTSVDDRTNPMVSPFYENLRGLKLPPALFMCGTEDPLLDDTVMMSAKWMMAGAEGIVKIFPGAPHGFIAFPPELVEASAQGKEFIKQFLLEKIGQ